MTAVDLYRVLVPFPIVGLAVAFLLLAFGAARKSESAKRVSLGALVLVAIIATPIYLALIRK